MRIIQTADYAGMSRQAANIISAQVILFPRSVLGLATGSTPMGIYRQLIHWYQKGDLDFSHVTTVNLDEYCNLNANHAQSYHYYMHHNFFKHINIDPARTHLPNGMAEDVLAECKRYDHLIHELGGIDLQLLGIGHNGHIGFNEPDMAFEQTTHYVELNQRTINANARFFDNVDQVPKSAITMGIKAIMQAKKILLVANGEDKAQILYDSLFGAVTPKVPASILQLHPGLTVVADESAMGVIRQRQPEQIK